jgi:hypothetical protein
MSEYTEEMYENQGYIAFNDTKLNSITFTAEDLTSCVDCLGVFINRQNTIEIKLENDHVPYNGLYHKLISATISHEVGHHVIYEYFDDRKLANDLVHYAWNEGHLYSKDGFTFVDVDYLIDNKEEIIKSIQNGTARESPNQYWLN